MDFTPQELSELEDIAAQLPQKAKPSPLNDFRGYPRFSCKDSPEENLQKFQRFYTKNLSKDQRFILNNLFTAYIKTLQQNTKMLQGSGQFIDQQPVKFEVLASEIA